LLSYEAILEQLGENLIKAGSANEALEQLLNRNLAIILIDVCMPELDGFQLATMIRDHPRFKKIAIIFVSAIQVTDLDLLRGYELGAVDYVPVPVVPDLLRAKVKVFAELYRKTRQLEKLNTELERRVAERTAELARANAELEQRVEERAREREEALAQVNEMQKLESPGQLTGGVAHDFNNLLTAVLANLDLAKKYLPDGSPLLRPIDGAIQGAERGANLTKRLLAFARRQELRPEAVDIAGLVDSMAEMLRHMLGPAIHIATDFAPGLVPIRVDCNQLELALINLAVNSRDAMPAGGQLTIAASPERLLRGGVAGLRPGEYVRIDVKDTGNGMDETTLRRAAEPFFTTKGQGRGTGLGLSMVDGLVAQSGGAMRISS
jgi:signal transduction histidine kinase